jgi:hypothetical protein
MPEEKKQELENAKRVVKKKHEGETEDGYLHVSSVDDSVVHRGGVIGSQILQIHMEKKKSESVRAVVEGRVTRAIMKALEKLVWQVTEKHVSDNARKLFGKPLKGKKEIKKCMREMSSKGKVRSAGKGKAHFTPSGEATMEVVLAPGAVGTPRGHNHGVPHVDIPRNGNRARACHCYTFLLFLDEVTTESGCVDFWVGTRGYEHDPKNPYQRVNKMEKERVKGKAGTLVVFDSLVVHQSIRNVTKKDTRRLTWTVCVPKS